MADIFNWVSNSKIPLVKYTFTQQTPSVDSILTFQINGKQPYSKVDRMWRRNTNKLGTLIDSPLLVNSDGQPELGETTDGSTDGNRKLAQKLTAVMQESQEQQKSDNENRTTGRLTTSILKVTKRIRESNPRKGQWSWNRTSLKKPANS